MFPNVFSRTISLRNHAVFILLVVLPLKLPSSTAELNHIEISNHASQQNVGGGGGTVTIVTKNDGVVTKITRAKNGDKIRVVNGKLVSGAEGLEQDEEKMPFDEEKMPFEEEDDRTPSLNSPLTLVAPGLDARKEIANYNKFMSEIFRRMNAAIKIKKLDPMDLKLLSNSDKTRNKNKDKTDTRNHILTTDRPIYGQSKTTTESFLILSTPLPTKKTTTKKPRPRPPTAPLLAEEEEKDKDVGKVRGWLYGMSTLERSGDCSIFIHENARTIQCPFSLGPLELRISRTSGHGRNKKTKTAKATTEKMHGLMDLRIDRETRRAEITDVVFDQPGEKVDVEGSIKKKKRVEDPMSNFKLELARKAQLSLKKVARLVTATPIGTTAANIDGGDNR